MNVEIQGAYPVMKLNKLTKKQKQTGWSVHAYIVDYDMDLRDCFAIKVKDSWNVFLPGREVFDYETGKMTRFSLIDFVNQEKKKNLIEEIRKEFSLFINEKIIQELIEKDKIRKEQQKLKRKDYRKRKKEGIKNQQHNQKLNKSEKINNVNKVKYATK